MMNRRVNAKVEICAADGSGMARIINRDPKRIIAVERYGVRGFKLWPGDRCDILLEGVKIKTLRKR